MDISKNSPEKTACGFISFEVIIKKPSKKGHKKTYFSDKRVHKF